jgi:hypothetical protein
MKIQDRTGRRIHMAAAFSLLVTVLSACAGWSSLGLPEGRVLVVNNELSVVAYAHTDELVDVNVPLMNDSGHAVRLVGFRLVPMEGARLVGTSAYNERRAGSEFDVDFGDLHVECPKQYPARAPVSAVILPPHRQTPVFGVATVVFTRPGLYNLYQIKVVYETEGHRGWQYQHTLLKVHVKIPARPGPTPPQPGGACQ